MAKLLLVRHAQAAFGTDDYDRLTELGHRQAGWLGDYLLDNGWPIEVLVAGGLRRHRETFAALAGAGLALPAARIEPGLDEYEPARLIRQWGLMAGSAAPGQSMAAPAPGPGDDAAARVRHFRQLRDALQAWCGGDLAVPGHCSFDAFQAGAYQAFEDSCRAIAGRDGHAVVVSSGGPIAAIIARHLAMPPASFVALNLQIRNTAVAEFHVGSRGAHLVSFNTLPHLDTAQRRQHITFS